MESDPTFREAELQMTSWNELANLNFPAISGLAEDKLSHRQSCKSLLQKSSKN